MNRNSRVSGLSHVNPCRKGTTIGRAEVSGVAAEPVEYKRATVATAMTVSKVTISAAVVLLMLSSANGSSVNDCHGVRYAYRERGLDLKDVPRQPRQGKKKKKHGLATPCAARTCALHTVKHKGFLCTFFYYSRVPQHSPCVLSFLVLLRQFQNGCSSTISVSTKVDR